MAKWASEMALPKPYEKRRYYTGADVSSHSKGTGDCWVSFFGSVYDLTPLLAENIRSINSSGQWTKCAEY